MNRLLSIFFALAVLSFPAYAKFNPETIIIFSHSGASALHPYIDDELTWPTSEDNWRNFPKWGHHMSEILGADLVNYAFAGATSENMLSAVEDYLSTGPALGFGDKVHFIQIGSNDGYMTFPVIDQDILDQRKSIISTMVSQLVGAGAQYVYVIDNPSNGRTPLFYFHAVANATDPTDQEEVEGIFNTISMIWGNNVEEANEQKWEAVSQTSPSAKRIETAGFFPELERYLPAYGFGDDSYVYCYLANSEAFPCLNNEYSEGGPDEDINKLVFWDGLHMGPASHRHFAEFLTDFIQMQGNRKYKRGYKFKRNSSYRSPNK